METGFFFPALTVSFTTVIHFDIRRLNLQFCCFLYICLVFFLLKETLLITLLRKWSTLSRTRVRSNSHFYSSVLVLRCCQDSLPGRPLSKKATKVFNSQYSGRQRPEAIQKVILSSTMGKVFHVIHLI